MRTIEASAARPTGPNRARIGSRAVRRGRQVARWLLLAAVSVGVTPAAAAAPSVPALTTTTTTPPGIGGEASAGSSAAPVTASALAARVTDLSNRAADLRNRISAVERQLAAGEQRVSALAGTLAQEQRESSALVAAARRSAVAAYMTGDPSGASFALLTAVGQDNVNDVTWSLGLLRSNGTHSISLAKEAAKRASTADNALTDAITASDRLRDERTRLTDALDTATTDITAAQADLDAYVKRLGPATISGLTTVAYDAYRLAMTHLAQEQKACGLRWELLAAIGKTESNHGAGRLDNLGDTSPPILSIPIGPDTDKGELDTDTVKDHAVGPMQFIPSTWRKWGADGNGDGKVDIGNIYDEALAAGRYLCYSAGADTLLTKEGVIKAIWSYNPNEEYLRVVGGRFEALAQDVASGWFSTADLPTPPPPSPGSSATGGGAPPPQIEEAPPQPPTVIRLLEAFSDKAVTMPVVAGPVMAAQCVPSPTFAGRSGLWACTTTGLPAADQATTAGAGSAPPTGTTVAPPSPTTIGATTTINPTAPTTTADPAATTTPPVTTAPTTTTTLAPVPSVAYDPCEVAGYDPTLLACLTDAKQPIALVRVSAPMAIQPRSSGVPHLVLELLGGDRCQPLRVALPPAPGTGATTTTAPTTTLAPSTTTRPPTTVPRSTVPGATSISPSTTTPVPLPPASYHCASGADVLGEPNTSAPSWTALVAQPGIAARKVPIVTVQD